MRSKLITFEGIDGSGKSTLAAAVERRLRAEAVDAVLTSEPTKGWLGEVVRRSYAEGHPAVTQALLFLADRSLHVRSMQAWMAEGKVVLCDRYADSTLAYQGAALEGTVVRPVDWLRAAGAPFTPVPDLTFLLILEPKEALRRVGTRVRSLFEQESFLARVQERYLDLAREPRFVQLDATRSQEVLLQEVMETLRRRFPPPSPR